MKLWLTLAAKIYPKSWRDRYGTEFDALLQDLDPHWTDLINICKGALAMRLKTGSQYLKIIAAIAAAGVIVALALSFRDPGRYVSSTLVQLTEAPARPQIDSQLPDRIALVWPEVVSHGSLSEMIQRPTLDLYKSERRRVPMETVIEDMQRDIRIEKIDRNPAAFRISFAYNDAAKAMEVANALADRLTRRAGTESRAVVLQHVPAQPPQLHIPPPRLTYSAWGLAIGLLTGIVTASLLWRPQWTLKILACGVAGYLAAAFLVFSGYIPRHYTSTSVVRVLRGLPSNPRALTDAELQDYLRNISPDTLPNIRVLNGGPTFALSATSTNRFQAQLAVSRLLTRVVDANQVRARTSGISVTMDLLDPPSLPEESVEKFPIIGASSMLLCMLLGCLVFRGRPGSPRPGSALWNFFIGPNRPRNVSSASLLRIIAGVGTLGVVIALLASHKDPGNYVNSALVLTPDSRMQQLLYFSWQTIPPVFRNSFTDRGSPLTRVRPLPPRRPASQ